MQYPKFLNFIIPTYYNIDYDIIYMYNVHIYYTTIIAYTYEIN